MAGEDAVFTPVSRKPQGKCAECGKPLKPNIYDVREKYEKEVVVPAVGELKPEQRWMDTYTRKVGERISGYGYMSQGYFCTLRCGWRFALRVLKNDDARRADR